MTFIPAPSLPMIKHIAGDIIALDSSATTQPLILAFPSPSALLAYWPEKPSSRYRSVTHIPVPSPLTTRHIVGGMVRAVSSVTTRLPTLAFPSPSALLAYWPEKPSSRYQLAYRIPAPSLPTIRHIVGGEVQEVGLVMVQPLNLKFPSLSALLAYWPEKPSSRYQLADFIPAPSPLTTRRIVGDITIVYSLATIQLITPAFPLASTLPKKTPPSLLIP